MYSLHLPHCLLTHFRDDGIVVARSEWRWAMEATAFVTVLRERLDSDRDDPPQDMLHAGEMPRLMAERFAPGHGEELADLQYQISEFRRELREEMRQLRTDLRLDVAERSADAMRWAMLFWVSQVVAIAGIVSVLR